MYILVGVDGKEYGPVPPETVRKWIADVRADARTKVRREGETEWVPLGSLAEFADVFAPPSPPTPVFEAVPVVPPASRLLRLLAALIDGLIESLCWMPTSLIVANTILAAVESRTLTSQLIIDAFIESIYKSLPLLVPLLLVQAALLTLRGQTIGKFLCGLRIVRRADDAPAGFVRAFLIRGVATWVFCQLPLLGRIFWLVDVCFIFRDDRRCLHDLMADTRVIRS